MSKTPKKRYLSVMSFVLLAVIVIYGVSKSSLGTNEINIANNEGDLWSKVANLFTVSTDKKITLENDPDYSLPKAEDKRWDLLVLGMRGDDGEKNEETGRLLTDTIMLVSLDKKTGKVSMVSIPRDLYVRINDNKMDKINAIYETGLLNKKGLDYTKKLFSRITGVYIDSAVVIDFSSFKKIIDDLGGIDINLDKPFEEKTQWGYEFSLPVGENHLDGQTALYYVRSRFSSSDFDRALRQQRVIMALKDKVMSLSIFSDPIESLSILNSIRNNIDTDLNVWDVGSIMNLSNQFNNSATSIKRYVITTENLLYETHLSGIYVLLPKGDNFLGMKQLFQDVLK